MSVTAVIGRDEELSSLGTFLERVAGGPQALVLSGEPGIGKTSLWEQGVEDAGRRFGRVLTCRGAEAEAGLSFAGLSELLEQALDVALPSLLAPRRRALEVALLIVEPGGDTLDPHAIGLAVLDVLRILAAGGPLLIAIDDAQWLDAASAEALQLALRRLREEPIGLLATLRVAPKIETSFPFARSFAEERLERLAVGPLSAGAVHRLLKDRLGLELTRPELSRLREATAGNPFFALELGRELVRTGTRPEAGHALRVPESLRDLLGGRLARLPTETGDLLLQVAALARPTVELVSALHGGRDRVEAALEAAVREGVVELDDSRIRFTHPLVSSICYEQAPVWKRRAVHVALAEAVADIEERARHLALAAAGPDASVAAALDAATEQAAARGATAAAAELSELAAELTSDDPEAARQRRHRAANFHRLAGDPVRAKAMLEELLETAPHGPERADMLFDLAAALLGDWPTLVSLYDRALAEAEGDEARCARILVFRAWVHLMNGDNATALVDARAALERAERVGDPRLIATAIARLSHVEMWAADVTPGLLERGAEFEEQFGGSADWLTSPRFWLSRLRMRQGRLDEARETLERLEADAVTRGDEPTRIHVLWYRSLLQWFVGDLQHGLETATIAFDLGEQTQFPNNQGWLGRVKALIETDLGLVEQARASAEAAADEMRTDASALFLPLCLATLGRLELTLGNVDAAQRHLADLPAQLLASGLNDPTQPVWADAIETFVAAADLEEARRILNLYEDHARRSGNAWAIASAGRCRGLLVAAEGDADAAITALEGALATLETEPYPLERGRTLLCLGTVRRQAQQKRAAREALEQALAIFEKLGARLWAERARAELRRISGRRAADDDLTETETRVAELAAAGRSNKEIAAELYMGLSTVEAHLSRVYRKLGVRSRTELARRLPAKTGTVNAVEDVTQA